MKTTQLRELLAASGLSPEQLGRRVQVSGMTLRRLLKRPPEADVPETYQPHLELGVYELIIGGQLRGDAPVAQAILKESRNRSFDAAIHTLGFPESALSGEGSPSDKLIGGLSQVGASREHQQVVKGSQKALAAFGRLSAEWKTRMRCLLAIITSRKLTQFEKFAAYGALFYLITVFDLIPDTLPVFGLMDDFGILGLVVGYYTQRFPRSF
jgi:uncharacterized membrane protein YkvA (DUF1232 family)